MFVRFVVYDNAACPQHADETNLQFSKKMFNTVYNDVFPIVQSKYPDRVQFIFRQQIQPWHPSSTLVHEAGVAVLQTKPVCFHFSSPCNITFVDNSTKQDKFWDFSNALFDKQTDYFDVNVVNEPRNKTYERLSKLAGSVGIDEKTIYSKLEVSNQPDKDGGLNIGNGVTNDLKLLVKVRRCGPSSLRMMC